MPGNTVPSSSASSARPGVADPGVDDGVGARQRRMRTGRWGDHGVPGVPRRGAAGGHAHAHLATSYPASRDRYAGLTGPAIRMAERTMHRRTAVGRQPATTLARSGRGVVARRPSGPGWRRGAAAGRRQLRRGTRRHPARGSRRRSGRRGARRSSGRSRGRGRCRPTARRAPGRSGRTRAACRPGAAPGPSSRPPPRPAGPSARTLTSTAPPRGEWRIALSTRIVDQLAQARRVALEHGGLRVDADADAAALRGPGERSTRRRPRRPRGPSAAGPSATAPESVRARSSRSSTMTVRWSTSAVMSSSASADAVSGSSRWRSRCSTDERITVSGVRSSWLASAANSRWRRRATRCVSSDWRIGTSARRAYSAPNRERDEHDDHPADRARQRAALSVGPRSSGRERLEEVRVCRRLDGDAAGS